MFSWCSQAGNTYEPHTPAIADGRLVLRGMSNLFCYDFRKQEGE